MESVEVGTGDHINKPLFCWCLLTPTSLSAGGMTVMMYRWRREKFKLNWKSLLPFQARSNIDTKNVFDCSFKPL